MAYKKIISELRKKHYRPVYFLHGMESYAIDKITDYIEQNVLTDGEKAFNQTVAYGKDAEASSIIDQARRYPMMAERQVIILKEAQEMRSLKDLQAYIEKPTASTLLVIAHKHKKLNMNTKLGKALKKHAEVFEAKKLYDNQIPDWIAGYLKTHQLTISPEACQLVAEYLGTDLSKIANELDKLAINLTSGTMVTPALIEQHIGISKDYNVFELQKILARRDVVRANRIVNYFSANPKKGPMPVVVASLYNFFQKVFLLHFHRHASEGEVLAALGLRSPFFLKEYRLAARNFNIPQTEKIMHLLQEYDLKSKGVGYISTGKPEGELLKEMVWKILH